MISLTYRENAFRAFHGLLHGVLVAQVGSDDLGALLRQLLGSLRVNVAGDGAGLERAILQEGLDDGGACKPGEFKDGSKIRRSVDSP